MQQNPGAAVLGDIRSVAGAPVVGVSEVQSVTVNGTPTGGTFTLRFKQKVTAAIAYDASAATVATALVALSTIGTGGVTVSGSAGGPYTVTFALTRGKRIQPLIALHTNSLTGGTAPTVAIAEVTAGVDSSFPDAGIGALLFDRTNGALYVKRGSTSRHAWRPIGQLEAVVQLTNAQMLAVRATPITLVAAPGAGRVTVVHGVYAVCDATAGVYTESADNLAVEYADGTDILVIETTGFVDQVAAVEARYMRPDQSTAAVEPIANSAVRLLNNGDGEFGGGNAANTLSVRVLYSIHEVAPFTA